jgi:hypothetical protein
MGSSNLRQQSPLIAGNPGPHNDDALSPTHDTGFGPNFPFTLISQQCCMQINGQGKAFSIFSIVITLPACVFANEL